MTAHKPITTRRDDLMRGTGRTTRAVQQAIDAANQGEQVCFVSASTDSASNLCSMVRDANPSFRSSLFRVHFRSGGSITFVSAGDRLNGYRNVVRDHDVLDMNGDLP